MCVQFVPGSSFLCHPPEEREDEAIEEYVLKINVCLKSSVLKIPIDVINISALFGFYSK